MIRAEAKTTFGQKMYNIRTNSWNKYFICSFKEYVYFSILAFLMNLPEFYVFSPNVVLVIYSSMSWGGGGGGGAPHPASYAYAIIAEHTLNTFNFNVCFFEVSFDLICKW